MPDEDLEPPAPDPRFGEYRVETERMADGRSIHYYSWPADAGRSGGSAGDVASDAGAGSSGTGEEPATADDV